MALPDILPDEAFAEDAESDAVKIHRWTRKEYEQAAEAGLFQDRRVELVDGALYDMAAQRSPHTTAVHKALSVLQAAFAAGWYVRCQSPLALEPESLPEPDLAVVAGTPDDYLEDHPSQAALIVEVADSSQLHDRKRKAKLYARVGVADYWIVNLRSDLVEVLRDPADGLYRTRRFYVRGETIAPLARPEATVAVEDLLPRHAPES